jgi:hypothetical protein
MRIETQHSKLAGNSAMNAIPFGSRPRPAVSSDTPRPENPLDAAWLVLEAANDLADHATVDACRRVIDASLKGSMANQSDLNVVLGYFR